MSTLLEDKLTLGLEYKWRPIIHCSVPNDPFAWLLSSENESGLSEKAYPNIYLFHSSKHQLMWTYNFP